VYRTTDNLALLNLPIHDVILQNSLSKTLHQSC